MTNKYFADGTPTHVAEDGTERKSRYGAGRQPWDDIKELGWAPHFAAGNVLKYLRRDKDREHSIESARWYFARLCEMAGDVYLEKIDQPTWTIANTTLKQLTKLLTDVEKEFLQ